MFFTRRARRFSSLPMIFGSAPCSLSESMRRFRSSRAWALRASSRASRASSRWSRRSSRRSARSSTRSRTSSLRSRRSSRRSTRSSRRSRRSSSRSRKESSAPALATGVSSAGGSWAQPIPQHPIPQYNVPLRTHGMMRLCCNVLHSIRKRRRTLFHRHSWITGRRRLTPVEKSATSGSHSDGTTGRSPGASKETAGAVASCAGFPAFS